MLIVNKKQNNYYILFFLCNHRLNFFPHTSLKDFDQWSILIDNQQNNIRFIIFFQTWMLLVNLQVEFLLEILPG